MAITNTSIQNFGEYDENGFSRERLDIVKNARKRARN